MHDMSDYERCVTEFDLTPPHTFNFATDVVDVWAQDPAREALVWCDDSGALDRWTYERISNASKQLANWLRTQGVGMGDRVIVMLPRVPWWQISIVACQRIGAVPIPCITMLTARDVAYRVDHSGASAALVWHEDVGKFAEIRATPVRLSIGGSVEGWQDLANVDAQSTECEPALVPAESPAIMYYTSGSTGAPKGVVHAARAIYMWRVSAIYWLTLRSDDTMWCTADTGWSKAGTSILFGPWSLGCRVLFYHGAFDPQRRFELIAEHQVSVFCAAATELRQLMLLSTSRETFRSLRLTVSAGESVNPEIVNAWRTLTGTALLDGYGQTETLMTVLNYPGMPVKPGSMGRPLPGIEAAVLDNDGRLRTRDAHGRLVIRSPNPQLMLGYWQDDERTASQYVETDEGKWFVTGDSVHIDDDGYYFYFGRDDDVINSSGYRIGPQEVENALLEHPAVRESAVVGLPDPARGEVVAAFVILNQGFTDSDSLAEELQRHVKQVTAPYKYPRRVEFVSSLPKTVSGKIQRNKLRTAS